MNTLGSIRLLRERMDKELIELIKAIQNRCAIILLIWDMRANRTEEDKIDYALPTILEDLHQDSQKIIDSYCVVQQDD